MGVLRFLLRAEFRAGRRGVVATVLILAIGGAVVIASIEGSAESARAHEAFLASFDAPEIVIQHAGSLDLEAVESITGDRGEPLVREAAPFSLYVAFEAVHVGPDAREEAWVPPSDPRYISPEKFITVLGADDDRWGTVVGRSKLLAGGTQIPRSHRKSLRRRRCLMRSVSGWVTGSPFDS